MASPSEKLAESLALLHELQQRGHIAIQAGDLSRVHRERLLSNGFLEDVIKGWYIPSRPDIAAGESTTWYASYWYFCAEYLMARFDDEWCLSPEQSLLLHTGNWTVPQQLLIHAKNANNKVTQLPHNTSLFDVRYKLPSSDNIVIVNELRLYSIAAGLVACSAKFYRQYPVDAYAVFSMIKDPSEVLGILLDGGHSVIAGRVAGGLRYVGKNKMADDIVKTMKAVGYDVREVDPFLKEMPIIIVPAAQSPAVTRMQMTWQQMRETILTNLPTAAKKIKNTASYLKQVDAVYSNDAYHSLSIEGYRVSPELIERVRLGQWDPENIASDLNNKNALAARGYWQAFQAVTESISVVLEHKHPANIAAKAHGDWYRELFGPSVIAGILKPSDLAGYRRHPVYIRHSMHVPPNYELVPELISAFFSLLDNEDNGWVRVVLGHFFFVYIHPYMDGNGRMGRFLMNVMLAAANYPWMIIPVEMRADYMGSLESASVTSNIEPFNALLKSLLQDH